MRLDKWLKVSQLIKRRTVFPQTRAFVGALGHLNCGGRK